MVAPAGRKSPDAEGPRPARPGRRHLLLAVALVLLLAMVGELAYIGLRGGLGLFDSGDFIEYWAAARLLVAGENPYDAVRLQQLENEATGRDDLVMMWNPPWTPVPFLPILLLPLGAATLAWLCLNLLLLVASATLLWKRLAPERVQRHLWAAWVAALLFMPALFTVRAGQISILLLFSVAGFFYFAERRQDTLAGAFLTLATIKLHVLYLFLFLVAWWVVRERRWRVVLGAALAMALWVGALLLIAPHSLAEYWQATTQNPPTQQWQTATLGGALRSLLGPEHTWLQFLPAALTGLLAVVWLLWRRPAVTWPHDLAPVLLISAPTAVYGWSFDDTVLLVVFLLVVGWALAGWQAARGPAIAVLAGLVLMEALLAWQNQSAVNDVYLLWFPFALGGLYLYAKWQLASRDRPPGREEA
jgi:hypothetical protein